MMPKLLPQDVMVNLVSIKSDVHYCVHFIAGTIIIAKFHVHAGFDGDFRFQNYHDNSHYLAIRDGKVKTDVRLMMLLCDAE